MSLVNVAAVSSRGFLFLSGTLLLLPLLASAISNYDKQGISQNYTEGLPEFATVNGLESNLGDIPSGIRLNKTQIYLDCSSDFMNITLTFREKFYGIVYADYNSQSNDYDRTCRINGDGHIKRELILSLKGCGTVQSPARVFINNIVVRFHPGLEMDGDEVITVICRYPEPRIINPPALPAPLIVAPGAPIQALQPLRDFEVLLIICAIIFLALLLLGFGCSYYCLKKRNIKVVRKRPASTLGSEITKASDPISMFSGLKIPRAHAVESSGSEQLTESIHTEYNSEEASGASEEEYHSTYSDQACEISEGVIFSQVKEPSMPEFDVKAIIKRSERPRSPESSRMSSDSELILKAQEQFLTTILERTETNTKETLERVRRLEAKKGPPPVHARIRVHNKQLSDTSELESESEFSQVPSDYYEDDMCLESRETTNALLEQRNEFDVNIKTRPKEIHYTTDEDSSVMFSDTESIHPPQKPSVIHTPNMKIHPGTTSTTLTQTVTDYSVRPKQPQPGPTSTVTQTTKYSRPGMHPLPPSHQTTTRNYTDQQTHIERRDIEPRQPDDTMQPGPTSTVTQTTKYSRPRMHPLPPSHQTTTRNYTDQQTHIERRDIEPRQPDDTMQPGPTTMVTQTTKYSGPKMHPLPTSHHMTTRNYTEQHTHIEQRDTEPRRPDDTMSQITTSGLSITDVHGRDRFDVFIRVLDPPDYTDTYDEISSVFTEDERIRIKEVILQDVKVQKLIETATTTNDFIHIKNQRSLQNIVEPQKWDVLIRILQNPINFDESFERESSRSTKTGASNQELRSLSEVMVDLDRRSIPGRSHINTPTVVHEETTIVGGPGMDIPGTRRNMMVDLDRRSIPGRSHINTPTVVHEETTVVGGPSMDIPGTRRNVPQEDHHYVVGGPGIDIPGTRRNVPQEGHHYVVTDSSGPGTTSTHEVHYYSSSPTRTQTITRELISGSSQQISSGSYPPGLEGPSFGGHMRSNPEDILAPIIHQVDEETGSTIRRVIQSVSQQEGFDVRLGFPDSQEGKKPPTK